MSDHISEELALILAVLDQDDPERRAALAHAESCAACTRLLQRGASMLSLIDADPVDVKVDPRLKARVLASVDKLVEEERVGRRWEPYALAIGSLLSIALALLDLRLRGGLFPARAPLCFMWVTLGALSSLAGVGIWARDWALRSSRLRLAVVAMGGALIGQLWLRVRCPTHDAPLHALTFHVSGVLLAALLGYLLARATWQSEP
jgi:hypothetical protein